MQPENSEQKTDPSPAQITKQPTIQPVQEQPVAYSPGPVNAPEGSKHNLKLIMAAVLLIIVISAVAYLLISKKPANETISQGKTSTNGTAVAKEPYLIYSDRQTIKAVGLDSKQIFSSKVATAGDYVIFVAKSPGGKLLLTENNGLAGGTTQYLLIDSKGNEKLLDKTISDALSANNAAVVFADENDVVYLSCPNSASQSCEVTKLNLTDGTATAIYDTKAVHNAFSIPGDVLGVSSDGNSVYVGMLPNSGTPQPAVYQIDIASGKVLQTTKLTDPSITAMAIAPSDKKVVYKTGGQSTPTVLHILDLASGQESTATWTKDYINDNSFELRWSPDSTKVLFQGNSSDASDTAVYDLTTGKITNLQNIPDSAHHAVSNQAWLDNNNIFYEIDTSTTAHDFRGSSTASYQQNVSDLKITKFSAPSGTLVAVIRP